MIYVFDSGLNLLARGEREVLDLIYEDQDVYAITVSPRSEFLLLWAYSPRGLASVQVQPEEDHVAAARGLAALLRELEPVHA